jgi:fibronectin type 3 domain-containing protein
MKRFLSVLLATLLIFGIMAPISVFAEKGPHPTTIDKADLLEDNAQYSALAFVDVESFETFMIYPTLEELPLPEEVKNKVSYDKETNTLTLTDFIAQEYGLTVIGMGDDFKIVIEGYNELLGIQALANGWGGSITLSGSGELILNRYSTLPVAIDIIADGDPSVLTIEKDVKLTAFEGDKSYAPDNYSICVSGSTAEAPVVIEAEVNSGNGSTEEYTHDIIEEVRVHDLYDAYEDYSVGLKKEGDDTIYVGDEFYEGEYVVSILEYDEALNLYIAKSYNEENNPIKPEDEGFTVIKDIPLYDEANNQYVGNPNGDDDESKKFVSIIEEGYTFVLKKCYDENGVEFAYSEFPYENEETGEIEHAYSVYEIAPHDKLGWVAKEIEREDDFTLNGYTPKVIASEKRYDYCGFGTVITNGSKALSVPGIVKNIKLENGNGYIKISFSPVKDAEYYDVYSYDFSSKKWLLKQSFEAKEKPEYQIKPVSADKTYYFIVIARNKVGAGNDSGTWSQITYRAPTKAVAYEVPSNGIKIKWYRHPEGTKYRLYRRAEGETSWTKITDTKNSNYTDKTAKYGVKYQYAVRIYFKEGYSASKTSAYITRVAKAKLVSLANNVDGSIKFTWKKAAGADGYKIYRKTAKSGWTLLQDIKDPSATTYIDKSAKKGTTYTYTSRAYNSNSKGTFEAGISIKCLATPVVKLSNASNGVKITWNKISGVSYYRVYRRLAGEKSWTAIKDTKSLSFTDTKASAGKNYEYTVRAISGTSVSSWNVVSIVRLKNPTLKTASATEEGIKVTWGDVTGAKSYNVYRKTAKSGWTLITNTTEKSFVDTTAEKGVTYIYTVRALNGDYISSFNSTGINGKY